MTRPSWDEYFMEMATLTARRSSCFQDARKVGAVIVKRNRVIATGYNGAPQGLETCLEKNSCMRKEKNIESGTRLSECYAIHAEQNAIVQVARMMGTSTEDATIYVTHFPCSFCVRLIIQAGIERIVYKESYPDEFAKELLAQTNILVAKMK